MRLGAPTGFGRSSGRRSARPPATFRSPTIWSPRISARSIQRPRVRVRAVLLGALAYFIMPFDAMPDFLAGIGFSDDITVLVAAIALVRSHITAAHREAAKRALSDEGL